MPRRNHRQVFEPIDLTPADLRRPIGPRPGQQPPATEPFQPFKTWRERERDEREQYDRQARARINGGIDWGICLVPG